MKKPKKKIDVTQQYLGICRLGMFTGALTFNPLLFIASAAMIPIVKVNAFFQGR